MNVIDQQERHDKWKNLIEEYEKSGLSQILRKAEREWEWIDRAPVIRMMKEETIRIRWLTHEEVGCLMQELPKHLVPLNETAMQVLLEQKGKHPQYVFTYFGNLVKQCNTKAWKNALARAGIKNFRWHDLRHTWASWHVQNGISLQELQQLGGWTSFEMVLRYAHLSSDHLKNAAERVRVTNWLQSAKSDSVQTSAN